MTLSPKPSLERLTRRLPQPAHPLQGRRSGPLVLPDNIICFQRHSVGDLNRPKRGRALHHRFVLILALRGTVAVAVDDRTVPLHAGEGLLIFPFQFHHYLTEKTPELLWTFITFDLADATALGALQYQPFQLTRELRGWTERLLASYLEEGAWSDQPALLLALLLARLHRQGPTRRRRPPPEIDPGLVTQVNQLAHRVQEPVTIKEIARTVGVSQSHLRARFRSSCGVSLGRHLRHLRLERACGLLRLTPDRVAEIAEKCGFSSIHTFSRAFRHAFGTTPRDYREDAPGEKKKRTGRPKPTRPPHQPRAP